ncbi:NAD-dependent succinate-semialdehyde dehydrogenase [Nocardioides aequoreus]|uniref:NAD-dependent succinate-semialdehyde dehydrogenase n=1 Tax=Nocardioides aequoreus TaxID=397278 RepID=UPI0004C30F35|nr:NAD-dependent succinate-semialdehyde dehydrogenase [Nocardioides aequoreus]
MTNHPDAARVLADVPRQLLVGGQWRDATGGATLPVEDPATGETLCEVADASVADGAAALDAAVAAQAGWAATPPQERSEILYRAFQLMQQRSDDLALLMTLEMGKSLAEAKGEVAYAAEFFRWNSGEALRVDGYVKDAANGQSRVMVLKQPVGPCFFITPWNFPAAMGTRKIAPAIAAGCTMVVKPAEQTPLSMLALAALLEEAGLPPGVLNVVPTSSSPDLSAPIIADPRLRKLSFTGSTEVGRLLIAQAADQVLKVSMELGGNAPFLVFDDADLDAAVEGAMVAKMRNMGEACTSANRFYVHASVAEEFAGRLAERMSALTLGHGADEGTEVGPLIDADQRGKVTELVTDAVDKGARALTGGGPRDGAGYFFEPTVLTGVTADARLLKEEIFGPVAPISTFTDEDEAIARANDTEYGLVSYLFTRDLDRALRVAERLESGMVGLNQGLVSNAGAPFGGVKASGLGREGGNEGLAEFLETKYVAIKR